MDTLKQFMCAISVTFIMFLVVVVVKVSGSSIDDLESEKKQNEADRESIESQLSDMSESQENLQKYVDNLGTQLESVNTEIEELESKITEKENSIRLNGELLDKSRKDEKKQFSNMKNRIQFLYEMGDYSYYEIFFSKTALADKLSRAEYVSELVKYDRKMLDKYRNTKKLILDTEEKLSSDMDELNELRNSLVDKKTEISDKLASSSADIRMLAKKISAAQASQAEYDMLILEQENEIVRRKEEESIRESIRESEEADRKAEQNSDKDKNDNEETTSKQETETYKPADEATEIELLSTIIYCEAGNQTKEGMYAVGSVVINRIKSPNFPNTMREVLEQPYQFTPVSVSGRFYLALERGEATEDCVAVATDILQNGVTTGDWLFFRVNDGSREGEVIDDQVFY